MTLFVRADADGVNPIADNANELYAGGGGVGAWVSIPMNKRVMPTGNFFNDPNISFFMTPTAIADQYWAKVVGYTNVLLDYYVMAVDTRGNTNKSDIQHVYVGAGDTSGGGGGGGSTNGCSGRVCVSPLPTNGLPVMISYDASAGNITSANPVFIHIGWNNWATVPPDTAMTFNAASNRWQIAVNAPVNATQLDCVFNNGSGTWDNNGGADWHFAVQPNTTPQAPATPTGLIATPGSNSIALSWSAAAGATSYIVNRGGQPLGSTTLTTYSDSGLATNTQYCYSITSSNSVGLSPNSTTVCATTSNAPVVIPPFVVDGALDSANYILSTNGIKLYAALRGTKLYVATTSPGTTGPNDHFIFVSDALLASPTTAAPWAKAGTTCVLATKPFISTESQNAYLTWNNAPGSSTVAKSSNTSGVLEGVIDLVEEFGAMPTKIYLCAAAYATADGGALASQAPAGNGANIETNELLVIPMSALNDSNADGKFDRVDPLRDFKLLSIGASGGNLSLRWAAMPYRTYQLEFANTLPAAWSNLSGSLVTAGALQLELTSVSGLNTNPPARFFRVKLLP